MMKLMNKLKITPAISGFGKRHKFTGQGMVEFALALPILLLVVYGLLETGRLLFIYSSTVTAARQAVRYGSATGNNDSGTPYYRDCAGIRNAAKRVGFINVFNDSDIFITYDRGLEIDGSVKPISGISPDPGTDTCDSMNDTILQNRDRIKVQVSTQWSPIIAIVPSWKGFTITSSSERTILRAVDIRVGPGSGNWNPGDLRIDVDIDPSSPVQTSFNAVGQVIKYTYTLTNMGTYTLTAPFSVADNIVTNESCAGAPSELSEGESFVCTGSYVVTQADLDAGFVTNVARASASGGISEEDGQTVPAVQNKSLTLTKTPSVTNAQTEGFVVTYTYKLTNSGNVTLSGPYSITDDKIPSDQIDCAGASDTTAPGAFTQCTATYSITATDIANGAVTNTATASAFFKGDAVVSNTDTAIVSTSPLELTVTVSKSSVSLLNEKIEYQYTLTNLSSSPMNAPYAINDDRATNLSCPSASSLAPGASTTCTGEYFVTQADLDAGSNLVNHAIATSNGGAIFSNIAIKSVKINQLPALTLTIDSPTSGAITTGTVITFNYVITNSGNVTLSAPYDISRTDALTGAESCPSASLAPLATITCTLTYTVTDADMAEGSITTTATAQAIFSGDTVNSNQASFTVNAYNGPRLTLTISSAPSNYTSSGTLLYITFTLQNTGSVTLSAPYSVSADSFLGTITCSGSPATLTSGQSTTCTTAAPYPTTSADMSAGSVNISATATASNAGSPLDSNVATLSIPSSFQCFVYHRLTLTPAPSITFPRVNQMAMSVINDSATSTTINIQSIELSNWNYSSHAQQYISSISFGGVQIATGNISQQFSPITYSAPYIGNVSLAPGQTKVLLFTFNKNYNKTNSEVIKVTFVENGCPVLNSSNGTQVK